MATLLEASRITVRHQRVCWLRGGRYGMGFSRFSTAEDGVATLISGAGPSETLRLEISSHPNREADTRGRTGGLRCQATSIASLCATDMGAPKSYARSQTAQSSNIQVVYAQQVVWAQRFQQGNVFWPTDLFLYFFAVGTQQFCSPDA